MIEAVIALVAGIGGAAIAFGSTWLARRSEERQIWLEKLADAYVELYHLESEYLRRCHNRSKGASLQNNQFSMGDVRRKQGTILLLTGDSTVRRAVETMEETARELDHATERMLSDDDPMQGANFGESFASHRESVETFAKVARLSLRQRIVL